MRFPEPVISLIWCLWPNLRVYTSGGVVFDPYQKSFNKFLANPITIIDTYLASEGFLAFQNRPESESMALVTDNGIYFEFVPFSPDIIDDGGMIRGDVPALTLSEVEETTDYILLISTVSGAWRYIIGDTIKFTNKEKAEIKITGRIRHFLDVVGSQLSVAKMNDAMRQVESEFNITIPEFTVAVPEQGEYLHKWYQGVGEASHVGEKPIQDKLDTFLRSVNKNYNVARNKALKGIEVKLITPDIFYDWSEHQKKKGGQVKVKRVMSEEEFLVWERFAGQI